VNIAEIASSRVHGYTIICSVGMKKGRAIMTMLRDIEKYVLKGLSGGKRDGGG
jgi:hypothetical protein